MEGAHAATVRDAAGFVDDVEAFRPGGVGVVGGVIDVVDPESDGVVEALDEIVGDRYALRESFRLGVADIILHVGLHLPLIGRVGFAYIHGQKVSMILVVVVNLHHVTDVATEGRSSVAAENDNERACTGALANVKMICSVEGEEASVRSIVPDFERAAVHVGQSVAEHAVSVLGAARHFAEKEKGHQQQDQKTANCPFPKESHRKLVHPLSDAPVLDMVQAKHIPLMSL